MRGHRNVHTCGCTRASVEGFGAEVARYELRDAVDTLVKRARKEHVTVTTTPDWDAYRVLVHDLTLERALQSDASWTPSTELSVPDATFLAYAVHSAQGLAVIVEAIERCGGQAHRS